MEITVPLPRYLNIGALYQLTGQIVGADGYPVAPKAHFDFGALSFIDGSGLTVLCNSLEWLFSHKVECYFHNFDHPGRAAICYLDDCGFFERYVGRKIRAHSLVRVTTVPFTAVKHADGHAWLENRFTPWMSNTLGVSAEALGSLKTCVSELFHNIKDHSTLETGYIHLQRYPNKSTVNITVSDFGRGIPNSIRERYGHRTDCEAIMMASQQGITSKSRPNNMGMGLDFLAVNVTGNYGSVSIFSYGARLTCVRAADGSPERYATVAAGSYPGTLIDIELRTDRFIGDEAGTEDVQW